MAEMKDPLRDFRPALMYSQAFSVLVYLIFAVSIYSLAGQYTTSPAIGSAPIIPAQIAYGFLAFALFVSGLVFGQTAIKYMYVVFMRATRSIKTMPDESARSWTIWVGSATAFWGFAFIIANSITVLDLVLSISAATFGAWFDFGISAIF